MWVAGGKYGSIDPCYPSKVAQAHIHHLLFEQHTEKKPLKYIFFPILTHVNNFVADTMDNASCPIVAGAPDVMKAAFTKEVDFFATRGIEYLDPALSFVEPTLMARRMFEMFGPRLGITEDENDHACKEAWKAPCASSTSDVEEKGRAILETVEAEDRVAILMIGRPYHSDPGLNHGIPEEFQVLGYPILSVRSIPKDREYLDRYYKDELEKGIIKTPARAEPRLAGELLGQQRAEGLGGGFAAHHPNVVVLDLSSFKCGHDAPVYGLIDSIIEASKTPYAALHDIDANKPSGSIKIRVKTYAHALKLHEERLAGRDEAKGRAPPRARPQARSSSSSSARSSSPRAARRTRPSRRRSTSFARGSPQYEVAPAPPEPGRTKGLVKLGKKTADGLVRLEA